jgi:hypothetical protein
VSREVYQHVPDLSWPEWPRAAQLLYARLRSPATTEAVLRWSQGPRFDVGGQRMGKSRRESYARNMLAWLSLRGAADYAGGKWRRVGRLDT